MNAFLVYGALKLTCTLCRVEYQSKLSKLCSHTEFSMHMKEYCGLIPRPPISFLSAGRAQSTHPAGS